MWIEINCENRCTELSSIMFEIECAIDVTLNNYKGFCFFFY